MKNNLNIEERKSISRNVEVPSVPLKVPSVSGVPSIPVLPSIPNIPSIPGVP